MSDAAHLVDEIGALIQDGNPLPVTAGEGSRLSALLEAITSNETEDGRRINDSLLLIIKELKGINIHLSMITGERISNLDTEG